MNNVQNICNTCGTQFPPDIELPRLCPICNDDRQYIRSTGQEWSNISAIDKQHKISILKINNGLYSFKIEPSFGIGQRAFLVLSPQGNILWDCIPLLNEEVIAFIRSVGGIKAIAFSHPHYYSNMNDWAETFDCPILIHELDEEHIVFKSGHIELWGGDIKPLWDGIVIKHIGGHFAGSSVLYIPANKGKGIILCGDTFQISFSKRFIAVMYSYPNQILLSKSSFLSVYKKTKYLEFDDMYGAFEHQNLTGNALHVFRLSMEQYVRDYE